MSLLVANWSDKQLDELADLLATGDYSPVAYFISRNFLAQGSRILYGGSRTDHAIDDVELTVAVGSDVGTVELAAGIFQFGSKISQVDSAQTINILNTATGTWGTGKAASGTDNRYSIICVKNEEQSINPLPRWFVDDAVDPNTYSQIDTNTQINKAYYDIQVVHGTDATNPSVPAAPSGYWTIAEIYVPANCTDLSTATIYDTTDTSQAGTPNWDTHTRVLRLEFYNDLVTSVNSLFGVDHDNSTGYHKSGIHLAGSVCGPSVTGNNLTSLTNGAVIGPGTTPGNLHSHLVPVLLEGSSVNLVSYGGYNVSWTDVDVSAYVPAGTTIIYLAVWAYVQVAPSGTFWQGSNQIQVRKKGTSSSHYPTFPTYSVGWSVGLSAVDAAGGTCFVGIDGSYKFQWQFVGTYAGSSVYIDLLGYV
jgi:hypothetical protein